MISHISTTHKQLKTADVIDTYMKQTVMIQCLTAEKVTPTEIHRNMKRVYGVHSTDVSTVRCWVRHFKSGKIDIGDKP
jgi:hypothetical protein